jgi:uncharacterized RDD family membrane protein YckC
VAALLIDVVAFSVIAFLAVSVASVILGPAVRFHPSAEGLNAAVDLRRGMATVDALIVAATGAAYCVLGWRGRGTLGQRLAGLDVVALRGRAPSTRAATVRWLFLVAPFALAAIIATGVPALTLLVWILVGAWYLALLVSTLRSPSGRGLHDRVAGTIVTRGVRLVALDYAPPRQEQRHAG